MNFSSISTIYFLEQDNIPVYLDWLTDSLIFFAYNSGTIEIRKPYENNSLIKRIDLINPIMAKNTYNNSIIVLTTEHIYEFLPIEPPQINKYKLDFTILNTILIIPQSKKQHLLIDSNSKVYSYHMDGRFLQLGALKIKSPVCAKLIAANLIVIGSTYGEIEIVQIEPFLNIHMNRVHSDSVQDIAILSENEFITASRDEKLICWSLNKSINENWIINSLNTHFINCLTPVSDEIWVGSSNGFLKIINFPSLDLIYENKIHKDAVRKIKVSPDNSKVITTSDDGSYQIIDIKTRNVICILGSLRAYIMSAGCNDTITKSIGIFGKSNGEIYTLKKNFNYPTNIAKTNESIRAIKVFNDFTFICCLESGVIEKYDSTGILLCKNDENEFAVYSINSDNNLIYCGRRNGVLDVYDLTNLELVTSRIVHQSIIGDIQISENQILTCSDDQSIKILNKNDLRILKVISPGCSAINNLCVFPDQFILATTDDYKILIIDTIYHNIINNYLNHSSSIRAICKLSDNIVASGDRNGNVNIWIIKTLKTIWSAKFNNRIVSLFYYPEIETLLIISEGEISLIKTSININTQEVITDKKQLIKHNDYLTILHLSDLHFGTIRDAQIWYSQLAEDLHYELKCNIIHFLIVSGDITNKSDKQEFKSAEFFIDQLIQEFNINKNQILLVPGNHDLNWILSKNAYHKTRINKGISELNKDHVFLINNKYAEIIDEEKYKLRFMNFCSFYNSVTGTNYKYDYEDQFVITHEPVNDILFLALNSAWQIDHLYPKRAKLNIEAVSNALNIIRKSEFYSNSIKIAIWHHPMYNANDDVKDIGIMEQLSKAGFRIILHGHLHKAENNIFNYDQSIKGRKIEFVGAGTFGAPTKELTPAYPWQYNFIKIMDKKAIIETRKREEENGAWKPDARWRITENEDPKPRYEIEL